MNTEEYARIREQRFLKTMNNPLSTLSIDVDTASYSNVRRFLQQGQLPPQDAVRIEEFINYFDYDYPQPEDPRPFAFDLELSACPWAEEHLLLHIGLQGRKIAYEDLPPNNLVFLLDVSGSMDTPNKLPLLKESLLLLTGQMRSIDTLREAKKALVTEIAGTLYSIANDVKIQIEFNPAVAATKLRYQTLEVAEDAQGTGELLLIKFRYKSPGESQSSFFEQPIFFDPLPLSETSNNFRFSAAAAAFALILRGSEHKGSATYDLSLRLAEGSLGLDREWYRKEFLGLVKAAQWLDRQ